MNIFCCDKNCKIFKGFSICSHVVATAQVNSQLETFLTEINVICRPNYTAISSQGMLNGAGRKGGLCKCKHSRRPPIIESRSLQPCLEGTSSLPTLSLPRPCADSCLEGTSSLPTSLLPRPCSHSDTRGTVSATALLQLSSQSTTIPSTSENQATTSIHALSHVDNDIFPSIPSFSCVVNSPTVILVRIKFLLVPVSVFHPQL